MQDLTGKTIGKYKIIEPQGKGGMATVFKAYDTHLERDVAIKLISLEQFGPAIVEKMRLRFDREAKTLARLTHPNIVNIIDYGEYEGIPYLVMPFLQGGTLKQFLGKPMPLEEAAGLLTPIADALAYAHQKGIVHRDVKPANIMFTEGGQPMLTDFGISRLLANEDGGVTLTATGMGIGTPEYMSPEQGLGHEVDGRTDIYSLGTVLYELITGQKPYTANTPMEIVLKQSTIALKKPSLIIPEIRDAADQVLLKAMAKEPEDRYESMKEFKKVLEGLSIIYTEPKAPPRLQNELTAREGKPERETDYFMTEHTPLPAIGNTILPPIPLKQAEVGNPKSKKWFWILSSIFVAFSALAAAIILFLPDSRLVKDLSITNLLGSNRATPTESVTTSPTRIAYFIETPTRAPYVTPTETLRINLGTYPDILDPQKASFVNEIAHLQLMYEGLTKLNTALETIPGAAEKWEYNADATEVTFVLRQHLQYSDHSLLNAKRFEYSILRNIDPTTAGGYAAITDDIAGAAAWRGADLATATAEQLAALKAAVAVHAYNTNGKPCTGYDDSDCLVLKVETVNPAPYIHTVLSLWIGYPAQEELIIAGGDTWWTNPQYQIGNGPFVLTNLEDNSVANFTPNPNYWGNFAKVNLEYRYVTDSAVAFEAYKNGEFDIIGLSAEDLATVQADAVLSKEANIYPGSCTYALMFHLEKEPFTDQKVREAFSYALDRDGWVKDVLKGLGSPTLTWIPKGFPGYDATENRWEYDPAAAQAALAASSYRSVYNLPQVTLTFSDTPRNRTRNEWLAANYNDVLDIDIKLNPVEATTYTALTKDIATAPQMYILGWCADYPDPQNWLSVYWKTGGFGERIGYSNPDLDALLVQADKELDSAKRMQLYADAQRLLTDGAPVAFFWNNVNTYMVKPYVKGITTTPMDSGWAGIYSLQDITIER